MPTDAAEDEKLRKERKDAGVSGILHTSSPVRLWDTELGPDEVRLQLVDGLDLTPTPGRALDDPEYAVTPDGRTVVAKWEVSRVGWNRPTLVGIDTETGERRVLADVEGAGFSEPAVSHDGRYVVSTRWHDQSHETAADGLAAAGRSGDRGESRPGHFFRGSGRSWRPSVPTTQAIFFGAFHHGSRPIFRVELGFRRGQPGDE